MSKKVNGSAKGALEAEAAAPVDVSPMSSVSSVKSKPPPEPAHNVEVRSWVIYSFWAVVVLLGLPVWLWTTSIHRASLPLDDMLAWSEGKV
jgi:phosphatidylinositol glycan class S